MKKLRLYVVGFLMVTLVAGCSKPQEATQPSSASASQPVSTPNFPAKKSHTVRYTVSNAQDYIMRDNFTIEYTDGNQLKSVVTKSNWETTVTAFDGDELHLKYLPSGRDGAADIQGTTRIYVDNNLLQEKTGVVVDCTYTIPLVVNSSSSSNAQLQQELEMMKQKQRIADQNRDEEERKNQQDERDKQRKQSDNQRKIRSREKDISELQAKRRDLEQQLRDNRLPQNVMYIQNDIDMVDRSIEDNNKQIRLLQSPDWNN